MRDERGSNRRGEERSSRTSFETFDGYVILTAGTLPMLQAQSLLCLGPGGQHCEQRAHWILSAPLRRGYHFHPQITDGKAEASEDGCNLPRLTRQ